MKVSIEQRGERNMPEVKMHSLQGRRRTTERLLTLMKQIRSQDVLTPKRLAVKLGVSERTVYRYLKLLQTNDL
jgi:DNA-binding CsgD family transcriptional regulator